MGVAYLIIAMREVKPHADHTGVHKLHDVLGLR